MTEEERGARGVDLGKLREISPSMDWGGGKKGAWQGTKKI